MTRAYIAEYGGLGSNPANEAVEGVGCIYDSQGNLYVFGAATYQSGTSGPTGEGFDNLILKFSPDGELLFHKTWWDVNTGSNCGANITAASIDNQDRTAWVANNWNTNGFFWGWVDTNGNFGNMGSAYNAAGLNQGWPTDISLNNNGLAVISGYWVSFDNPDQMNHAYDTAKISFLLTIGDLINSVTVTKATGVYGTNSDGTLGYGQFNAVIVDAGDNPIAIGNYNIDDITHSILVGLSNTGSILWQYQLDASTNTGDNNGVYGESVATNGGFLYTASNDLGNSACIIDKFSFSPGGITSIWRTVIGRDAGPGGILRGYDINFDSAGNPIVSGIQATNQNPYANGWPVMYKFDKNTGALMWTNLAYTYIGAAQSLGDGNQDPYTGHKASAVYQDRIGFACFSYSNLADPLGNGAPKALVLQVPTDGSLASGGMSAPGYVNITGLITTIATITSYTPIVAELSAVDLTSAVDTSYTANNVATTPTDASGNGYSTEIVTLGYFSTGLYMRPGVTVRPGVTLRGNQSGFRFTLSTADFTTFNYGSIQNVTNSSFTVPSSLRFDYCNYNANLGADNSGDQTYYTNLLAAWTAAGLVLNDNSYAFNVTWGAGGTPSSTVVFAGLYNDSSIAGRLIFAPVYTGNNDWQTSGTDKGTLIGAAGDYNLPITFTLIQPTIHDNNNWC